MLNKLNEEELRELNKQVVARLNLIHRAKRLNDIAKFNIGDRAYFIHNGNKVLGTIIRLNHRSVSFKEDDGRRWTIDAGLLTKIIEVGVKY